MYIHTYVYTYVLHTYIHTYTHTHTHTHIRMIHTYIHTGRLGKDGSRVCQNSEWPLGTVRMTPVCANSPHERTDLLSCEWLYDTVGMTPVGAAAREVCANSPHEQADLLSCMRAPRVVKLLVRTAGGVNAEC